LRLIRQKSTNDCCIAALAMISGMKYKEAAKIIKPNSNIFAISLALNNLNIDLIPKKPVDITTLGLLVVESEQKDCLHTIVKFNGKIYDPDKGIVKLSDYKVVLSFEVIKND
jgi:hypothetical protein